MKKFLPLIIISLFTFTTSFSQTKMDDIRELVKLMSASQDATIEGIVKGMQQQMSSRIPDTAKLAELTTLIFKEAKAISKNIIYNELPQLYDSIFTQQEIKDCIKFYKSPSGKKLLDSQAEIQKQIQNKIAKRIPELQRMFSAKLSDMHISFDYMKLDSITAAELKKGPVSENAFMTFQFGDSPEQIKTKTDALIKESKITEGDTTRTLRLYTFKNEEIFKGNRWKMEPKYSHDSLIEIKLTLFSIDTDVKTGRKTTINDLQEIMEKKYGAVSMMDTTTQLGQISMRRFYWIKGNVKIYLSGTNPSEKMKMNIISISFSDTRKERLRRPR